MRQFAGIVLMFCIPFGSAVLAQDSGMSELIGIWDDVTPERESVGKRVTRPRTILTFDGSACTWEERGGHIFRRSLFIPAQAGSHRGLDFVTVSSGAFWTTRALFKIEGDTLTIKEGALDRPRPTDLNSWESDGRNADAMASVHVFKRRVK